MSVKALNQYLEFLKIAGVQDIFIKSIPIDQEFADNDLLESKKLLLQELSEKYADCQKCELHQGRIKLVYGQGNADAKLMVIGEAPGAEENKSGQAFVGKAGQLLDRQLKAINLTREEIYIANIVKCRPPGNRDPHPVEMEACMPYLQEQIEIIQPQIFLFLGRIAAQALLNTTTSLGRLRLTAHILNGIPAYVTYHPAAVLRFSEYRKPTWEDLQKVRDQYFMLPSKQR
ncbi:MAG: uracil-DNA glycosylase [Candidatus Stygibacter frigidus]|nr:uracil-DNA glycosylase [Candidatus Stygibacter frigidus]